MSVTAVQELPRPTAGFSIEPIVTVAGRVVVLIVRGGADHQAFGDPYEWAMMLVIADHTAEIKALSAPRGIGGLLRHVLRARLRADYGVERVTWDRRGRAQANRAFDLRVAP